MEDRTPELPDIPPIELLKKELARETARYQFWKSILSIAVGLLVAAAITALIATRILILIRIDGNSMAPTLQEREVVFLRQTKEIDKGDIVGFYYGGNILLKRVIGTGGDVIMIDKDGNVSVNGQVLSEPYLTERNLGKCDLEFPYQVPEGMLFVLGDNRAVSLDSRSKSIGCVEKSQITGKVIFRAWPLGRLKMMH